MVYKKRKFLLKYYLLISTILVISCTFVKNTQFEKSNLKECLYMGSISKVKIDKITGKYKFISMPMGQSFLSLAVDSCMIKKNEIVLQCVVMAPITKNGQRSSPASKTTIIKALEKDKELLEISRFMTNEVGEFTFISTQPINEFIIIKINDSIGIAYESFGYKVSNLNQK